MTSDVWRDIVRDEPARIPPACCESRVLERCCLEAEKTACCGAERVPGSTCGCQPSALARRG